MIGVLIRRGHQTKLCHKYEDKELKISSLQYEDQLFLSCLLVCFFHMDEAFLWVLSFKY